MMFFACYKMPSDRVQKKNINNKLFRMLFFFLGGGVENYVEKCINYGENTPNYA